MMRILATAVAMSVFGCGGVSAPRTGEPEPPPPVRAPRDVRSLVPDTGATCDDTGWCRFDALTPAEWADEVRLGPDGALWLIGEARVVRWADDAFTSWWLDVQLVELATAGARTWVVGADGYAAYRDDGEWQRVDTGVTDWLAAVSGLPDGAAYAVSKGQLLQLTAQGVTPVPTPEAREARDVSAIAVDDVWVAGDDIWRWDGARWTALPAPAGASDAWWSGIHAIGPRDVWALRTDGAAYHWDGARWQTYPLGVGPSSRVHADGGRLQIFENETTWLWDGARWVEHHAPFEDAILASDGRAIGADYDVYTARGATLSRSPRGIGIAAHALWAGDDAVWVGGAQWDEHEGRDHGAIARWDGARWQVWHVEGQRVSAIDGAGGEVWMLSDDGRVHGWDGTGWIHESPGLREARAIAVLGPDDVWATDGQRLMRRTGGAWRALKTPGVSRIEGLDVGLDGMLLMTLRRTGWPLVQRVMRWTGDAWELVSDRNAAPTAGFVALSDGDIVTADNSTLASYTGGYPFHVWDVAAARDRIVILGRTDGDERTHVLTVVRGVVTTVRLPAADLQKVAIAPDGSVWAIQVPGGDVWFRPR